MECEQQFSLSWNNFHCNVSQELSEVLGSGALADVTLAVDGRLLQAHRLVLAICSPYFKTIFQINPHHHPIVVLRDVSHGAMCSLLQFMYRGEVSVRREDLSGFIATAELLQIKGLTNKETDKEGNTETPKPAQASTTIKRHNRNTPTSPEDGNSAEIKRKMLNENIQRLNHLRRTSEQFLHNFYRTERPRSQNSNVYDEAPTDIPHMEQPQENDISNNYTVLDLKTECDDNHIMIADSAIQDKFPNYPLQSHNKDLLMANHDSALGLGALLVDLESLAGGRVSEECHRLVSIPQKRDGKKKYPQRSCRSCGQIGRRRDTRFMCGRCDIPFCKTPCFQLHLRHAAR